ncbi:MAG: glycosyl hydrolase 53 family protein, partial [Terriglobales bacterium]
GTFADPSTQKQYLDLVGKVAEQKPEYFILLVEANLYKDKNPTDYEAFKRLLPDAIKIVREKSPATKVGVSITFGDHNGRNGIDNEDTAYFRACVNDFDPMVDMVSVSTYPFYLMNPANLQRNFVHVLAMISPKPLFISETSWVSESFDIQMPNNEKYTFLSSEEKQAEYYRRVLSAAKEAVSRGDNVLCVNFVSLTDPKPASIAAFKKINPQFAWFTSLAMCDNSGKPKESYNVLKDAHAQK